MQEKKFKLLKEELQVLVEAAGACYASDKITVEGLPVGFMYREKPNFDKDSGWRFLSGTEDQYYVDNPNNLMIYDVNTIANYDQSIIPYLEMEIGTELEKQEDNTFKLLD